MKKLNLISLSIAALMVAGGTVALVANESNAVRTLADGTQTITLDNGEGTGDTSVEALIVEDGVFGFESGKTVTVPTLTDNDFLGYFTAEGGEGDKIFDATGTWTDVTFTVTTLYADWDLSLAAYKTAAKTALTTEFDTNKANYTLNPTYASTYAAGVGAIDLAETKDAVNDAKAAALSAMQACDDNDACRAAAKAELEAYNGGADGYNFFKDEYETALADAKALVDAATTAEELAAAVTDGEALIYEVYSDEDVQYSYVMSLRDLLLSLQANHQIMFSQMAAVYNNSISRFLETKTFTEIDALYDEVEAALRAFDNDQTVINAAMTDLLSYNGGMENYTLDRMYVTVINTVYSTIMTNYEAGKLSKAGLDSLIAQGKQLIDQYCMTNDDWLDNAYETITTYNDGMNTYYLVPEYVLVVNQYLTQVYDATNYNELSAAVLAAMAAIDELQTSEEVLAAAEAEIRGFLNPADYTFTTDYQDLLDMVLEYLEEATEYSDVYQIVEVFKQYASVLPTDADYVAAAKLSVDSYKGGLQSFLLTQSTYSTLVNTAKDAIDEATSAAELQAILEAFEAGIDALKTDAQIRNEYREAAQALLATYDEVKYTEDNFEIMKGYVRTARVNMLTASSTADMDALLVTLKGQLDSVPQIQPAKQGCGGSIVATSVLLSTLALAGAAIVLGKKRKED